MNVRTLFRGSLSGATSAATWRFAAAMWCLAAATVGAAPRTWIGGNNDWIDGGSTANWSPADEPDSDDEAIFNSSNAVNLGSDNVVNGLTMSGGIDLSTNGFDLTVNGLVQLSGVSTNLFVGGAGSDLSALNLSTGGGGGGIVELTGGTLQVLDPSLAAVGVLGINSGGALQGNGIVNLDGSLVTTTVLNNNGTLTALSRSSGILLPPPVGSLVINAGNANARIDLDGSGESGVVNVNRNQTLTINGTLSDAFNGTMNMFQSTTLNMANAWTLGAGGQIVVDNGLVGGIPGVPAGPSTIAGGTLTQTGGTISVLDTDGVLNLNSNFTMNGGSLINHGQVRFNGAATIAAGANFSLASPGAGFTVGPDASLVINQANFDLDGPNGGVTTITVEALGQLVVNSNDYDLDIGANGFDGVVNLNNGDATVQTADARFVMNGVLNMLSNIAGRVTVWSGQPIDIGNDLIGSAQLNVTGDRTSRFGSAVRFRSDAVVNVAGGATLDFNNTVTFEPVGVSSTGQFTGAGRMQFNGAVNVNEATTLNMVGGTVDLDGVDSTGDLISVNAALTINAATMESFGRTNVGGGVNVIHVDALSAGSTGSLTVNLDSPGGKWTINPQGTLSLSNTNSLATLLAGSDVAMNGSLNIVGQVGTAARIDIGGTVNILTAFPNGGLMLQGGSLANPNTSAGALINGPGALRASTGRALKGFGTINARVEFEGTAELIADGGTLNVTGVVADVATLRVNSGATLNLTNSMSTSVTNNGIEISGGTLQGSTITVASIAQGIRGTGTVTNPIVNNGALEAQGGTLLVNNFSNDWDGGTNAGQLRASGGGTLHIQDNATVGFGGTLIAVENSRVFSDGFGLNYSSGSSLLLTQGTYESTNSVDIAGTVVIGAGAPSTAKVALNSFLDIEPTATVTLNGNLRLESNNARIKAGATFGGTGAIVVPEGPNNLVLDPNANVNVLVDNAGTVYPGGFSGVGRVDLRDYQQRSTGRLFAEIEGTGLNQFDRLVVDGIAQLDGYLNVDIDGGFVPAVGNTFSIISATGGISGTFNQVDIQGFPLGLTVKVNYLPTIVQLEVVNTPLFSADFDKDGDVDATDLTIWRNAYHLNQLGDATGDNKSDGSDFLVWQRQFGSKPAVPIADATIAAVPEPTAAGLILAGAGLAVFGCGRRRA
ncbi:MAG: hypothetical protein KF688_16575 [Pirellulales bacterium]|nr:hypothetical protein [Pirellulales bacterium]